MERLHVLVALVVAVAVAVRASPVSSAARTLVPEVIDMGVTGRRSLGPGPAGVAGEEGEGLPSHTPHAHLTLAITPAPTAHHYQHVQGGFVRSEPESIRPQDEESLQSGLTRRKRDHQHQQQQQQQQQQQPADQEAEATSQAEDDAEAAASAHDDGDMFLEPDAATASTTGVPEDVAAAAATTEDTTGQPQNLFPAFQPLFPLGHSRPPIFQEPVFNQRQALLRSQQFGAFHPHASLGHHLSEAQSREPRLDLPGPHGGPHGFRERAYPQPAPVAAPAELHSSTMLGSGNFGVIHGGTFYGEEKEAQEYDSPSAPLHSFYGGNGHGRPAFYRGNPEPQRYRTSEDFFANFRDFADISTPTKSSFSEYYVVYVNRNASRADAGTVVGPTGVVSDALPHAQPHPAQRPNNIFERLAQIDLEHAAKKDDAEQDGDAEKEVPQKKVSLGKRKLALLNKKKGGKKAAAAAPREVPQRDAHEPLLALS